MTSIIARFLPCLMSVVCAFGCGSDRVRVYPVKGKITFDGKPLVGGGAISFVPVTEQTGKTAGAEIRPDGTYELTTYDPGDGSMAGEFRVTIFQVTAQEGERTIDGQAPKAAKLVAESERIPAIYADPFNSPLNAKVEAKIVNEIDFDLKR